MKQRRKKRLKVGSRERITRKEKNAFPYHRGASVECPVSPEKQKNGGKRKKNKNPRPTRGRDLKGHNIITFD